MILRNDPIDDGAHKFAEGIGQLEAAANAGLVLVTLSLWGLFLWGLSWKKGGLLWFYLVSGLHFLSVAFALLEDNQRVAWQFLRFGMLGGIALIIGLPHYFYEPGERARPRMMTAVGVVVAFGAIYAFVRR